MAAEKISAPALTSEAEPPSSPILEASSPPRRRPAPPFHGSKTPARTAAPKTPASRPATSRFPAPTRTSSPSRVPSSSASSAHFVNPPASSRLELNAVQASRRRIQDLPSTSLPAYNPRGGSGAAGLTVPSPETVDRLDSMATPLASSSSRHLPSATAATHVEPLARPRPRLAVNAAPPAPIPVARQAPPPPPPAPSVTAVPLAAIVPRSRTAGLSLCRLCKVVADETDQRGCSCSEEDLFGVECSACWRCLRCGGVVELDEQM